MPDPEAELNSLRDRIESSAMLGEDDRQSLLTFDRELAIRRRTGTYRHLKLLRHCTIMAEQCGSLTETLHDVDSAKDLVHWIHDSYPNEETNRDYRVALNMFGRLVCEDNGDEPPETYDFFTSNTSRNYDPTPDLNELFDWEDDILPMLDAARNSRDKAAIALQFDAGLRPFEFADLTVGDILDHRFGLKVRAEGKQGKRRHGGVTLVPSVPYVNQWLADHPALKDDQAPLWSELATANEITHRMKLKMIKEPGRRADITKPLNLRNLRRSSASFYASHGMSQAALENRYGWKRGSDIAARYVALHSGSVDRELAQIHGIELDDEETEPIGPIECPRCEKSTPREKALCVWCGQALEPQAAEHAEEFEDLLVESIAEASEEEAQHLLRFREASQDDPTLRAELVSQISNLLAEP